MRKLRTKIGAMIASAMLAVAMMAMPAGAATAYTAIDGSTINCTVDKYLVVKSDAVIPNASFDFTIAPGTAIDAEDGKMAVYAGSNAVKLVAGTDVTVDSTDNKKCTVSFDSTDATIDETDRNGYTVNFSTTTDTSDEKFARKSFGVDFSDVTFSEPGVYRWIITEDVGKAELTKGIKADTIGTRTIDVYVSDNAGALGISACVLHEGILAPAAGTNKGSADVTGNGVALSDKSTGFTNKYGTQNLSFAKTVDGNQGSKDKFFQFKVTVTGVHDADSFQVIMTHATTQPEKTAATVYSASDMASANTLAAVSDAPAGEVYGKITGEQLKAGKYFYLSNDEYITILGLPEGAVYTVEEEAEDYLSTDGAGTYGGHEYTMDKTGEIALVDVYTGFTNTRDGVIPTGVILSVAPWVIAGIVIIGGIVFFAIRSRKKYEEE